MATFTKVCFYCGDQFEAAHPLANICSPDCRERSYTPRIEDTRVGLIGSEVRLARSGPNAAEVDRGTCDPVMKCPRCGRTIQAATEARKYCSPACRRSMQRKNRKMMIRRAYVEPVSMSVLRRRDEDMCRICGGPVDFTRHPPHPSAATIDHVIPLAKGGEHSYGNTQLAHYKCNTAKGAGPSGHGPTSAAAIGEQIGHIVGGES